MQSMKRTEYVSFLFGHFALFTVFVWFGSLKLFGLSPAGPLVTDLFNHTLGIALPFLDASTFVVLLGGLEVLIGILFLIPHTERIALYLLIPHMITTIMPLFLLPEVAWQSSLVPTLEGQYMIKNILIVALFATVYADRRKKHNFK